VHKIGDVLRKNSLVALGYENRGNTVVVTTNNGKYVVKKNNVPYDIKNYLRSRNFDYIPNAIYDDDYIISEYIEGYDIPKEQKIQDIVELTALLHNKTTHYKETDLSYYNELYNDLSDNIEYLTGYYNDLISIIEEKVFMSPSEYLLARNIKVIFENLHLCHDMLEDFYELVKEKRKQRLVVLHNNLDLDHYIRNNNSYLVSWDKAKIGEPIFDIYKLYKKYALDFDFDEILKLYENHYPLFNHERLLLFVLISAPNILSFNQSEYKNCINFSTEIDTLIKTREIVLPYYTEYRKHKAQEENKQ
jgi:formylmethanofuran dehydrogenase subunit D